jgi:hypothetical protein
MDQQLHTWELIYSRQPEELLPAGNMLTETGGEARHALQKHGPCRGSHTKKNLTKGEEVGVKEGGREGGGGNTQAYAEVVSLGRSCSLNTPWPWLMDMKKSANTWYQCIT